MLKEGNYSGPKTSSKQMLGGIYTWHFKIPTHGTYHRENLQETEHQREHAQTRCELRRTTENEQKSEKDNT